MSENDSNNNVGGGGIGFLGLLTIVFVTLKLTHFIDWSWWWVLAPLWAPFCIGITILIVGLIAYLIWRTYKDGRNRKGG